VVSRTSADDRGSILIAILHGQVTRLNAADWLNDLTPVECSRIDGHGKGFAECELRAEGGSYGAKIPAHP
jgi:hypothetical protein